MTTRWKLAALLASLTATACGGDDPDLLDVDALGRSQAPIIGGTLDTERDAVVAIFGSQSGCTGTIVAVQGGSAYVLTAAHCFDPGPIQQVVIADDYQGFSGTLMNVTDYEVHPQYGTQQGNLIYDFAMIEAGPAGPNTPVIPALRPQEDDMGVGSDVVHVGYGLTENGSTSQRHQVDGNLTDLAGIQIAYDQPNGGPCSGDSGGPQLYDAGLGERVAGVTSFGDENCQQFGVSGRASAVYDSFIVPFIGTDPTGGSTVASTTATTSTTTATSGAGAGSPDSVSSGGVGGAGGAVPSDEPWSAGLQPRDYDGTLLSASGCSVGGEGEGEAAWWGLLALGLGLARRRRPRG